MLSDVNAPLAALPLRRAWSQKATELCGEVKALGSALLAALEKRDAEDLALLRSSHEIAVLERRPRGPRSSRSTRPARALDGLDEAPGRSTEARRDYYRDIEFMNAWETVSTWPDLATARRAPDGRRTAIDIAGRRARR